jgi:hypothetical protein
MPPRKSDVAKAANEEAATAAGTGTPAKADTHKEKDGINIEVRGLSIFSLFTVKL